uniref:Histidine--tRNA ligase, chloroplastic n=1 Tax=Kuetzingia canaliculata TaxID=228262 RepID=A0A1Z1MQC4_KUECA|nr:Histidine-tRNA ligase [Kuetzingia canaliculata]ARW67971.1 Histidine-tRNA ligase [Kuetzingia canaliculata]
MQPLRGTKDILPYEIQYWQYIYNTANKILSINNYEEIRTPILENTALFQRSIGNLTDIVNKEMYSFIDQGERNITLRPEGTASIARAFISNKLYGTTNKKVHRLWYLGPMFRYERPQKGRQRQFHQLGIECLGSSLPIADVEVIRLAIHILEQLKYKDYTLEINSIGNIKERDIYAFKLKAYLNQYINDLDEDSKKRLNNNPLRILDTKNRKIQDIIINAPKIKECLTSTSIKHFNQVCEHLQYLNIPYKINNNLVRGLDYYNYTAFEIKTNTHDAQNTICGGGRYDQLIEQLGGPKTPSVGWAMGLERLLTITQEKLKIEKNRIIIYIIGTLNEFNDNLWDIIKTIEKLGINFELDLSSNSLYKQIRRANQLKSKICFIIGEEEVINQYITVKWLDTGTQQQIKTKQIYNYLKYLKQHL